jgi:hypothetical protein
VETLSNIFMTSGVNEKGEGFITIAAHGDDGTILIGQMSPDEVRKHALAYLESAEAADQDAAVLRIIQKLELPEQLAGMIIGELRENRKE